MHVHIVKAVNVVRFRIGSLDILTLKTVLAAYPCRCEWNRISENRVTYVHMDSVCLLRSYPIMCSVLSLSN
jgi:L-asparagine transporter-like permease